MKCLEDVTKRSLTSIFLAALFFLLPQVAAAECDCTQDTAIPPFLAEGAIPNLLLMVDNSASMLDTFYTDTTTDASMCYDDTYNPAEDYFGYFDNDTWYAYNLTGDGTQFEIAADGSDDGACAGDSTTRTVYTG